MDNIKTAYNAAAEKLQADKKKRLEALNKAARPLTPCEMERPYYRLAVAVRIAAQFITFAAGLGFLLFLNTTFDSLFVIGTLAVLYFALEPIKSVVHSKYHSYRIHQPYTPKVATVFIIVVSVLSIGAAALGSEYGYEKIIAQPHLISLDSVQAKQDAITTSDTSFWASKANAANAAASAFFNSRSWKGRISSKDRPAYNSFLATKAKYNDSLTVAQARAEANTRAAIVTAYNTNTTATAQRAQRIEATKWVVTAGVLVLELLVIFLFKWCADFVERERIEQNAIAGIKKPKPINVKQVVKEVIKDVQTPTKAPKAAARVEIKQLGHKGEMTQCLCGCGAGFPAIDAKRYGKKFAHPNCKRVYNYNKNKANPV